MCQSRDFQSLVQREFTAHLVLTFILLFQYKTAQKGDGKVKNQSQHFFSGKADLSAKPSSNYRNTFQYFPSFFPSFLPVTAVLQRWYAAMNDKLTPKLFFLKETLISYSWHMTLCLKNLAICI